MWKELDWNEESVGIPIEDVTIFHHPAISSETDAILSDCKNNGVKIVPLNIQSKYIKSLADLITALGHLSSAQFEGISLLFHAFMDEYNEFNLNQFIDYVRNPSESSES